MSDLDRWVDLEGPPPAGVRELLEAAAPPPSPELLEELDRRVQAAIAADERRAAKRRRLLVGAAVVGGAGLAVCLTAAVAVALLRTSTDVEVADEGAPPTGSASAATSGTRRHPKPAPQDVRDAGGPRGR